MTQLSNDIQNEMLSAMFDGEASELEVRSLLKSLNQQVTAEQSLQQPLQQQWIEIQQLNDKLQQRQTTNSSTFLTNLRSRIEEEELQQSWLQRINNQYRQPLRQTAAAACIAVLSIVGVQQYQVAQLDQVESQQMLAVKEDENKALFTTQYPAGFNVPPLNTRQVSTSSPSVSPKNVPQSIAAPSDKKWDAKQQQAVRDHIEKLLKQHVETSSTQDAQQLLPALRTTPDSKSKK